MDLSDVLSADPEVMSGAVLFKGTRVPVEALVEYLAAGDPLDEFLSDFPGVERAQAQAAIKLGVAALTERLRPTAA